MSSRCCSLQWFTALLAPSILWSLHRVMGNNAGISTVPLIRWSHCHAPSPLHIMNHRSSEYCAVIVIENTAVPGVEISDLVSLKFSSVSILNSSISCHHRRSQHASRIVWAKKVNLVPYRSSSPNFDSILWSLHVILVLTQVKVIASILQARFIRIKKISSTAHGCRMPANHSFTPNLLPIKTILRILPN